MALTPPFCCKVFRNKYLHAKYSGIRSYAPFRQSARLSISWCAPGRARARACDLSFFKDPVFKQPVFKEPVVLSGLCALLLSLGFLSAKSRNFAEKWEES